MNRFNNTQNQKNIYILIFGILLILITTLFPYDFFFLEILNQLTVKELFELLTKSSSLQDIILNLLLFIPFGFGFSDYLNQRKINNKKILFLVAIASLGFSLIIECLQFFLPGRTSTPIDLFTNTLSGVSGGLIYQYWGQLLFYQFNLFLNQVKSLVTIPSLTLFFLFYFILTVLLSLPLQNTNYLWSLENWNTSFPLNLRNELTGNRPWKGEIQQFCLSEKLISRQEIQQILQSNNLCNNLSQLSAEQLIQKIRETDQFTLKIKFATADTDQIGPARILSISKDLFQRNLTLGQWRSHLSIRIRNPVTGNNGTRPELMIPNVFSDFKTHTILLLYHPDQIQVYFDSFNQKYDLIFTPEMAWFWQNSPVDQGSIHLNSWNLLFYKILYYSFIFLPLGGCLGLICKRMRGRFSFYLLLVSLGVIFPTILLEILLSFAGSRMISWINLLLSFGIVVIGLYLSCKKSEYL